jgi:catechol-2,3-dioxygenase
MFKEGPKRGIATRGISDHHFIHSIYFRDPNGYVIELTAKLPNHDDATNPDKNDARGTLNRWQAAKADSVSA